MKNKVQAKNIYYSAISLYLEKYYCKKKPEQRTKGN